jgi:hypothetical protein
VSGATPRRGPPAERNAMAEFVVPWYRFAELEVFEPWERARVVEEAVEAITTIRPVLAGWAITLVALATTAVLFTDQLKQLHMGLVLLLAVLAFLPLFFYRRSRVHALVRAQAAQRGAQAGAAGSRP